MSDPSSSLAKDLERIVGARGVSVHGSDLDRFGGDALGSYRALRASPSLKARPSVIVWPVGAEQVSAVLKLASRQQVPVVPYGGGTGVMGAATPADACIVLNLQRMSSVLGVSGEDMTAGFQAGVLLDDASSFMEAAGLVLGHDPWSRPIATVGGAISTDGVGYTAAKYGSMGDQVLGLQAVLASGEIVRTRDVPNAIMGQSLNRLLIGSEGTFGVITEATMRAFPRPGKRLLRSVVFPDFESGFAAVRRLYAEGVRPSMIDYGEESWPAEPNEGGEATLYVAFEGFDADVEAHYRRARNVWRSLRGVEAEEAEARRFWETRHAWGERYRRDVLESRDPGRARQQRTYRMDYIHVSLPSSRVLDYRAQCERILASHRVIVREWSLWARPEFFSFLVVDEDDGDAKATDAMADAADKVLMLAQDMGGTMEYCHGVGVKLAHLMDRELGDGMAVLRRLKKALDPAGILNPGKLAG